MLHLITGGNGTGKTLNTIKWVRDLQLRENRPVAYNGRFDAVAGGELAGWKVIDFADWQDEPDGTIFLIDECHNDLPKRAPSAAVPAHVRMLGEHRKRGFDFYLITQHPSNIDVFVRKLIASPGWHRHLKRSFGVDLVSVLEWAYVNEKCELPNSSKNGTVTMVPFPKEVYGWYTSASLHTGKKKIPKQLLVFLALLVIVPLLLYFGITRLVASTAKKDVDKPEVTGSKPAAAAVGDTRNHVATTAEYIASYVPRIEGLPHTAPAYDEMTKPTRVPVPAACISWEKKGCHCFTQDGTKLNTTEAICKEIASHGFFEAFQRDKGSPQGGTGPTPVQRLTQSPVPAGAQPAFAVRSLAPGEAPRGYTGSEPPADLSMYAYAAGQRAQSR